MLHKIQTGNNNFLSLEVKNHKGEHCLLINKGPTTLVFNFNETKQLNILIQSIDVEKYILKEYGSVKKGSDIFKITLSEFRGIKSFQIRQREITPTYSGFGKLGVTLPIYKIKELQMHMKSVMGEFIETK